jgi:CheY-like chemotaxis protein
MKLKEPKNRFNSVLLLDDSTLDNFINQKMLESANFAKKIYVHTSGESALEFLLNIDNIEKDHAALYPEVIFIDINMPVMDGFQFISGFKAGFPTCKVAPKLVLLTSSVSAHDRQKAKMIDESILFLNKPLLVEMLDCILPVAFAASAHNHLPL